MKNIYMCGHTGSINRGCEAIVRSTARILKQCGVQKITLMTFNEADDRALHVDDVVELRSYPHRPFVVRGLSYLERRLLHKGGFSGRFFYQSVFRHAHVDVMTMNIGGDTYCYGTPYISYALNRITQKYRMPNIFWGCSVDERALSDVQMQADLNQYSFIVARESLTREILSQVLHDKKKLLQGCDPAFHLPSIEIELPVCFKRGNTVGLNLSPLVFNDAKNQNDMMYRNAKALIDYIIQETDMNVCLIPHVYRATTNEQDSFVLGQLYAMYEATERISLITDELSCTQLKFIISQCRFFIGSRTHATIAAYSTGVPTIAISYSIKSRGIAKDLFGTEDQYAIEWEKISDPDVLRNVFIELLVNNEAEIRGRYARVLPEYKQSILTAAECVLKEHYEK